jgi:hypothetical protein
MSEPFCEKASVKTWSSPRRLVPSISRTQIPHSGRQRQAIRPFSPNDSLNPWFNQGKHPALGGLPFYKPPSKYPSELIE